MAKRYKQTVRDRMNEGEGMVRSMDKKKKSSSMSSSNSMMIHEDHSAMANLPQKCIMKEYSKNNEGMGGDLNDNLRGVDSQIKRDVSGMRKEKSKVKY